MSVAKPAVCRKRVRDVGWTTPAWKLWYQCDPSVSFHDRLMDSYLLPNQMYFLVQGVSPPEDPRFLRMVKLYPEIAEWSR